MKNLLTVIFLFFAFGAANAQIGPQFRQIPKNILCGPVEILFTALTDKDIKENPIWLGKDESEKSDYALFVNTDTGAFTLIQFGKEWGCILGIGYKSESFKPKYNQ